MPNLTECRLGTAFRVEGCMIEADPAGSNPDESETDFVVSWTQDIDGVITKNASFDNTSVESTMSGDSACKDSCEASGANKKQKRNSLKSKKPSRHISGLFRFKKSQPGRSVRPVSPSPDGQTDLTVSSPTSDSEPTIGTQENSSNEVEPDGDSEQHSATGKSSWLLRLFESSLFNMDMALQYLFKTDDDDVRAYLANRLFGFSTSDVDFYLLQLVSLYQKSPELAKHLHRYFIHRCMRSTEFAIHLVWLLDTFAPPKQRDALRSASGALCRPSSVPTFSQVTSTMTSVGTLLDHSTGGSTPRQLPPHTQSNQSQSTESDETRTLTTIAEPQEYTAQNLRSIVFPTQEPSLLLLNRIVSVSTETSLRGSSHSSRVIRTNSELRPDKTDAGPSNTQHNATLPLTGQSVPSDNGRKTPLCSSLGHKRAVSDISFLASHPDSHGARLHNARTQQQTMISATAENAIANERVHTSDRWSSEDSAVGLSHDLENEQELPNSMLHRLNGDWSVHSRHACSQDRTFGVTGSCFSVNKIITKEPSGFELRAVHSLQRLSLADVPTASDDTSLRGLKRSAPSRNHIPSNHPVSDPSASHDVGMNTASSMSPPDSGLQLVITDSSRTLSDDKLTVESQTAGQQAYLDIGCPLDPTISLQLQLVPRLVPEWDFMDGLLRLARRLIPISSKEQRTAYLQAELANLNLHLPARVWLPVNKADHIVLRIPPTAAVCLNSKDKAPYLIYLEVLPCRDPWSDPLPSRPSSCHMRLCGASSFPTGATSLTSLSQFPWNSSTPSSTSGASAIAAPDALSLVSSESSNSAEDRCSNIGDNSTAVTVGHPDNNSRTGSVEPNPLESTMTVQKTPLYVAAGDIRSRLKEQAEHQPLRSFKSDPEDPSAAVLKEPWHMKCQRIRELSPWGSLPGWRLTAAIVKVGDDLRQEQLAYQLLSVLQRIWKTERVPLWLRPLTVIVTSPDSGLIEPVPDTVSLHQIRRHARLSLLDYFHREYGPPNSEAFLTAQRNFVESCAAYCLVGFLLQVKDRHNGNILLDNEGHVIHIDYGFMLSASPGKNLGFETSPFKLTSEQVAVMGEIGSDMFEYYKCLLLRGLLAARKHMEEICVLVEIARVTCPQLPCFARSSGSAAISGLRQRFQLSRTEEQLRQSVDFMVDASLNSMTTRLYDRFQYYTNGIQ
ncbi:hypothetical protein CRM22_004327 [Opisthorchis felineus]|uniref:Phosphatidylinositol 4-kinase beta n=1 Tax=Opisthorchis felineus TaxID=147828 RepID=A0A4S2LWQ2_OPIFE|nr:hypothetical protein CRM22_004327 [Opisthorchis felineus]